MAGHVDEESSIEIANEEEYINDVDRVEISTCNRQYSPTYSNILKWAMIEVNQKLQINSLHQNSYIML